MLDAEILADVYLLMSGGQTALSLSTQSSSGNQSGGEEIIRLDANRPPLTVIQASDEELAAHEAKLSAIEKSSGGDSLWRKM